MMFAAVVVTLTVASAIAQPGGGPPPALVRLDAVRMERVEQRREVTGELRAVQRAQLAAEEEGLVVEVHFETGDWVQEGQLLAKLDDKIRKLDLDRRRAVQLSAEATIREREAQIAKAERDLKRLQELQSRQGASKNEVDDGETRLREEEARLAQSKADLAAAVADVQTAEKRLKDMTILAPFSGNIVTRGVEVGEWVVIGESIAELVSIDSVDAYLDVPERFIGALSSPDVLVRLRIPALGTTIETPITTVIALGDRLARTFPVRIRLENKGERAGAGRLKPGMSVVGLVPTGEPTDALTIHKDAVLRNDAGSYVYFDAGGVAAVAPVEQLFAFGERVVIRSQLLKPGMNVITEGNERIFPGQPLMLMDAAPRAGAPSESAASDSPAGKGD